MLTQRKKFTESEKKRLAVQMRALERERKQKEADLYEPAPLTPADKTLPICVIVDIDGTLSKKCDRHWMDFDKSIDDEVDLRTKFLIDLIAEQNRWKNPLIPSIEIILITGRDQRFVDVTNRWLNRHDIPFDHLYMRRVGDKRASYIIKEEIWSANIKGKYNVWFVIDDREQDVRMYRSKGLYVMIPDDSRTPIQNHDKSPLDNPPADSVT